MRAVLISKRASNPLRHQFAAFPAVSEWRRATEGLPQLCPDRNGSGDALRNLFAFLLRHRAGFAIVNSLVEAQGGTVWVESTADRVVFGFSLPSPGGNALNRRRRHSYQTD